MSETRKNLSHRELHILKIINGSKEPALPGHVADFNHYTTLKAAGLIEGTLTEGFKITQRGIEAITAGS